MSVRMRMLGTMAALLLAVTIAAADDASAPTATATEEPPRRAGAAADDTPPPTPTAVDTRPPTPVPGAIDESVSPPERGLQQFQYVMRRAGTLLREPYLTGEWGGFRTTLNNWGVVPNTTYFADIQGNPIGGKVGKVRYVHDIGVELLLDFQRMFGWQGSSFHVSMSSRAGSNLSADIGNVFIVAEACCDLTTRLVTLAFEQSWFEHRLDLRIGRLSTGDDFMTSPLYLLFINSDVDGNPFGPLFNVPYTAYPGATWGARVRGRPFRPLYIAAGVYDGDPDVTLNGAHGTDFSFRDSVLVTFETGYEPAHHLQGPLPGHYKVGGYYHTGRFSRFDAPPDSDLPSDVEHGNAGYYFLIDQMIYREDGDQGLWPFAIAAISPSEEINPMPLFFSAGLSYQGLIPKRDGDVSVASVSYGGFSRDLRRSQAGSPAGQQDFEMVVEWGYIIQFAPWLHVEPDFQYIIKPGGTGHIPDALVIGMQIGVNL
jgi:porin